MSNTKVVGRNFNPSLVGLQITDINDKSLLTYTNFKLNASFKNRTVIDYNQFFSTTSNNNTLNTDIPLDKKIEFKNDNSNPLVFNNYGSTLELFRSTIDKILLNYPASIYCSNFFENKLVNNIIDYQYDVNTNIASFKTPALFIVNRFGLIYSEELATSSENTSKNIVINYNNYAVYRKDLNKEYGIISFKPSEKENEGELEIEVVGDVFGDLMDNNIDFHIKPNFDYIRTINNQNLTEFEKYFINDRGDLGYNIKFKKIIPQDNGKFLLKDKDLLWTTTDGYNLDVSGTDFEIFYTNILTIGEDFDDLKTDIVYKLLVPESLKKYDLTEDGRMSKLLRIYGKSFDEIKLVIDNINRIYNISYDDKNSTSDQLIYLVARSFGLETYDFIDEADFLKKITSYDISNEEKEDIPEMLNIESWRRILTNVMFLFKNKGTRKVYDFLFRFFGFDESLYTINEFVYKIENKVLNIDNTLVNSETGYPNFVNSEQLTFQQDTYFKTYENVGYDFSARFDKNNKCYVFGDESQELANSKEVLIGLDPVKHIEYDVYKLNIKPYVCIDDIEYLAFVYNQGQESQIPQYETDLYDLDVLYPVAYNPNFIQDWYPVSKYTLRDSTKESFAEYIENSYRYFINSQNRKVISDGQGGGYPTLKHLYYDYVGWKIAEDCIIEPEFGIIVYNEGEEDTIPKYKFNGVDYSLYKCLDSNQYTLDEMYRYLDVLNINYMDIIENFIPYTTIAYSGTIIKNLVYTQQKFVYKRGINESSEFKTDLDSFQEGINKKTINKPYKINFNKFEVLT